MRGISIFSAALAFLAVGTSTPVRRQDDEYVGYLMTTFIDALPQVHWHLSQADDPLNFTTLNGGDPVLVSDVGTGGVRDMFLVTNTERSEYFMLATGECIPEFGYERKKLANMRRKISISTFPTSTGMMQGGMAATAS